MPWSFETNQNRLQNVPREGTQIARIRFPEPPSGCIRLSLMWTSFFLAAEHSKADAWEDNGRTISGNQHSGQCTCIRHGQCRWIRPHGFWEHGRRGWPTGRRSIGFRPWRRRPTEWRDMVPFHTPIVRSEGQPAVLAGTVDFPLGVGCIWNKGTDWGLMNENRYGWSSVWSNIAW